MVNYLRRRVLGLAGAFEQKVTVWKLLPNWLDSPTLAISAKSLLLALGKKSMNLGENRRICRAETVAKIKVSKRSLLLSSGTTKGFRSISGTVPLIETVTFCSNAPASPSDSLNQFIILRK